MRIVNRSEINPSFLVEDFEPLYLDTWRQGKFDSKAKAALAELGDCRACPRDCGVDRLGNETAA